MSKPLARWIVFTILATFLSSSVYGQCGVERWSVKTGTDADVSKVNLSSSSSTAITTMRSWPAPSPIPANNRVSPYETTQWVLNATLTQYKLESDSDYHLVLSDASGNTMIAEIPSPNCVGSGSPFGPGITNARNEFDAKYIASTSFKTANIPVQIRGVGMFDFLHGQTGVAPNGIEIHPVLDIIFNPGTGGGVTTLTNGQAVSSLSGATGSWQYFKITVPASQTSLAITTSGGTGDEDVYVKLGAQPTSSSYDYRGIVSGNAESITVTNPGSGDWYIGLFGYAAYSGVTLKATYTGGGGGDTTPPTTSITAPTSGAIVSGTTSVTASASDNVGVTKVEFYLDGALQVTDTTTPYSWSWNTTTASNASHTISSKAYDAAGNVGSSSSVTVTVNNSTSQQLLGNPGFETGSASPWTASAGIVDNSTTEPAHSGSWKAWLDGYGATHTDTLLQQVTIPSTSTSATLSFYLHIDTAETTTTTAYDTLTVQIRNSSGTVLATMATYSNLNAASGYSLKSFSLNSYIGQTIQVYLVGAEDSTQQTSFVVDDFALNAQ